MSISMTGEHSFFKKRDKNILKLSLSISMLMEIVSKKLYRKSQTYSKSIT